ncbi:DUF4214 domain-containing protein [Pararhizobium haloflavum]|uniref:DUF4214 domain-containing protein n=1 Tax=Pararhizobium haloflavum TaxID=2037914 RepID=UPI000C17895F|nr:DUF4214 domain-containing protein [Pararhizobium haloflavum]
MASRWTVVAAFSLLMSGDAFADPVIWGVNGHPIASYPGVDIDQQLDYVADLGMTSYRVDISHESEVVTLAELARAGKARGIEILPVITPGNVDLDEDSVPELHAKARALAIALAAPLKDEIRVWELGNEMENHAIIQPCEMRDDGTQYPCEWGPAGGLSADDYYGPRWAKVSAVLDGLSEGIDEVDPDIRKAIGTAGWGHIGAFERIEADGIDWDISVWHAYGQDPEWAFKKLAVYDRPIWLTEFNHPLGSQNGELEQAEGLTYTLRRLLELNQHYPLEAAHIYELLDETYWAPDFEAYMGLVRLLPKSDGGWVAGEPKPAYTAVRDFIRGPRDDPPARTCDLATLADPGEEGTDASARYAYCLILGRAAEEADVARWQALATTEPGIAARLRPLLSSPEFAERYGPLGMSDRDYVAFLFELLLGREADAHGLDSYAAELKAGGLSRTGIALGIVQSGEFRSRHAALFAGEAGTDG